MSPVFDPSVFDPSAFDTESAVGMTVVRAVAVDGQTVRVVFSEQPQHRSPAALDDALCSANYTFRVVSGDAVAPICVGASEQVALFPVAWVADSDQVGVDVRVDRPFVVGILYAVTVSSRVVAASGNRMGTPRGAQFSGNVRSDKARPQRRELGYVDVASNPIGGSFLVDDSGDLASESGELGYKHRVLRRATTRLNSFTFLDNYGTLYDPKKPASVAVLQQFKGDLEQQIRREPESGAVQTTIRSVPSAGVVEVRIKAKTKTGREVGVPFNVSSDGEVVIP